MYYLCIAFSKGKPVRFWHRPAAVIRNPMFIISKVTALKVGRPNKGAISQKTCCMHKGILTRPRGTSRIPKLNTLVV